MVNERSPAKAPLKPVVPNEQPSRMADHSYPSKPQPTTVPRFGQPTLPQSPLHRPAQKESSVFIQPKSRPEHHRDVPGGRHPHLQAVKDANRKVMDPLLPKAPAGYHSDKFSSVIWLFRYGGTANVFSVLLQAMPFLCEPLSLRILHTRPPSLLHNRLLAPWEAHMEASSP